MAIQNHMRPTRSRLHVSWAAVVVMIVLGLIIGFGAASARNTSNQGPANLVSLVQHRQDTVDRLSAENSRLKSEVESTTVGEMSGTVQPTQGHNDLKTVSGPGVEVVLTDAPPGPTPEGASPDDLVIHQQDIEDVMNALWAGGAEAMTVQGQRITTRSVVRCIGNVVLVNGTAYSPPYKIAAMGNTDELTRSVNTDPRMINYQLYVARYGLGWDMSVRKKLTFPAASDDLTIKYAHVEDHG